LQESKRVGSDVDSEVSPEQLQAIAKGLFEQIAKKNNDPPFVSDARCDTVAVGLTKDDIIVTTNLKERRGTDSMNPLEYVKIKDEVNGGRNKATYANYDISEDVADLIVKVVKKSGLTNNGNFGIKVVADNFNSIDNPELTTMMAKARDHHSRHAETKMLAHCEQEGSKLEKIGISKPACTDCYRDLSDQHVEMRPETPGNKKKTNWENVAKDETKVIRQVDKNQ